MSKLSTPELKIALLKEGYSKAKRLSKSKLSDAIVRVFETEQGTVEVKTTLDDTSVISIYKQESKDSMKPILWFNNFEEAFERLFFEIVKSNEKKNKPDSGHEGTEPPKV
jgi:hypothetical protein